MWLSSGAAEVCRKGGELFMAKPHSPRAAGKADFVKEESYLRAVRSTPSSFMELIARSNGAFLVPENALYIANRPARMRWRNIEMVREMKVRICAHFITCLLFRGQRW